MATGTTGTTAQKYHTNQVHYLVKKVVFGDDGTQLSMGYAPAGAIISKAEIDVITAFNDGGNDYITVGTAADPDGLMDDVDVSSTGLKTDGTTFNASNDRRLTADTEIVCQYDGASSDATTGLAYVRVEYVYAPAVVDA